MSILRFFYRAEEHISWACQCAEHDDPLNSPHWGPGWERILSRHILHTTDNRRPRTADYVAWAQGLMVNTQKVDREGRPGAEAYALLKTGLMRSSDSGDHLLAITRIQTYVTPFGAHFRSYLICYNRLGLDVMQVEDHVLCRQGTVIHAVNRHMWAPYCSAGLMMFQQSYASSRAYKSYAELFTHLRAVESRPYDATAVPTTHLSVPSSRHEFRALSPQTPSTHGHVRNVDPVIPAV